MKNYFLVPDANTLGLASIQLMAGSLHSQIVSFFKINKGEDLRHDLFLLTDVEERDLPGIGKVWISGPLKEKLDVLQKNGGDPLIEFLLSAGIPDVYSYQYASKIREGQGIFFVHTEDSRKLHRADSIIANACP